MKLPVIGLTLDWRDGGHYSKYPWYALRENYCKVISDEGAVPVLLPFDVHKIDSYVHLIDGLVVTGGDFDVDPSFYGETCRHERVLTIKQRTAFEFEITKKVLEKNIPVLGICGGHQLINVVLGGTLIQHIPDEIENHLAHEQPNPRHEAGHLIDIEDGSKLKQITGQDSAHVNSAHHQAVKTVGKDVVINSYAADGVIEGIEHPGYKFCMGVQWHPEFLISSFDKKIFETFVKATTPDA